jgi:(E)-4-hydroxy-3-methylbut-2-enyl-diphosphate synthase
MLRRNSREIKIGKLKIGGNNPIAIQSMTNTKTEDIKETTKQILSLENEGCELVRIAVANENSAKAISKIKKKINIPLVADIHFDYKLAILAIQNGADKIRINPGNIGSKEKLEKIVKAAKLKNIPIRIGVNSGSLEKDSLKKFGKVNAEALAESAVKNIVFFEKELAYNNIVLSIKSKDIVENYEAHKIFVKKTSSDIPIHIGITEAGIGEEAIIKSSIGIGSLLLDGIGDTIRVSLTGSPLKEIPSAKNILQSLGLRDNGINIISCPTCGRTEVALEKIVVKIKRDLKNFMKTYKGCRINIAIMGCMVNGPGEAKDADFGFAFGKDKAIYFEKGFKKNIIDKENLSSYLIERIKNGI